MTIDEKDIFPETNNVSVDVDTLFNFARESIF
jgi:hypothetical protein